jgi:hypothetical protein
MRGVSLIGASFYIRTAWAGGLPQVVSDAEFREAFGLRQLAAAF